METDDLLRAIEIAFRNQNFVDAVSPLRQMIKSNPDDVVARYRLGVALNRSGNNPSALEEFRILSGMGVKGSRFLGEYTKSLIEAGRDTEAVDVLTSTIATEFLTDRQVCGNYVTAVCNLGDFAKAEALLLDYLSQTRDEEFAFKLGEILLAQGRYEEGWPLHNKRYEIWNVAPKLGCEAWDGQLRRDEVLMLHTEQGFGDAILFARFGSLIARQGYPVVIAAQDRLVPLLKTLPHVRDVVTFRHRIRNAPARWYSLSRLAPSLDTRLDNIPQLAPYLFAQPSRAEKWRHLINPGKVNIGICWQGNPNGTIDRGRSFPLDAFKDILLDDRLNVISLQQGPGEEQIQSSPFANRITVPAPGFDGEDGAFLDSAALMMHLDLVISSDTAVAHLAGAMDRPCFIVLKHAPFWYWAPDKDQSSWYRSIRLFRQPEPGDWQGAFQLVSRALEDAVGS